MVGLWTEDYRGPSSKSISVSSSKRRGNVDFLIILLSLG